MPPASLDPNNGVADDTLKLRRFSKKKIFLSLFGTYFWIIFFLVSWLLVEKTWYFVFFLTFENISNVSLPLIILTLRLSPIVAIITLFLCIWNLWYKDTKWLILVAVAAVLGGIGSFVCIAMLSMGDPPQNIFKEKIQDCSHYRTDARRDKCYDSESSTVEDCKKIINSTLQEKCIIDGFNSGWFKGVSSCNELDTLSERDSCREFGLAKDNSLACLTIEEAPRIDMCLSHSAKTVEQCDLIKSPYFQSICYGRLNRTPSTGAYCNHFSDERSAAFCYDMAMLKSYSCDGIYINEPVIDLICQMKSTKRDSAVCNKAPTIGLKDWCLGQLNSNCSSIGLPDDKFFCNGFTQGSFDMSFCSSINDEGLKMLCKNTINK